MLLHPTSHVAAMEASMCAGAEGSEVRTASEPLCTASEPSRWLKLVDKYLDVFKPPGMPAELDIVNKIKLESSSQLPYQG